MTTPEVSVQLQFLKWQLLYETEKPFQIFINIPSHVDDKRTTNLVFENVEIAARDIRGVTADFDLDRHGFTYCNHKTKVEDFGSRDVVDRYYLPEIEELLRNQVTGVDRVFFFDWRVRSR